MLLFRCMGCRRSEKKTHMCGGRRSLPPARVPAAASHRGAARPSPHQHVHPHAHPHLHIHSRTRLFILHQEITDCQCWYPLDTRASTGFSSLHEPAEMSWKGARTFQSMQDEMLESEHCVWHCMLHATCCMILTYTLCVTCHMHLKCYSLRVICPVACYKS